MAFQDESKQRIHTVILNLVIGTLYCSKGNFEFGISRIIKSFDRSVGAGQTTWVLPLNLSQNPVSVQLFLCVILNRSTLPQVREGEAAPGHVAPRKAVRCSCCSCRCALCNCVNHCALTKAAFKQIYKHPSYSRAYSPPLLQLPARPGREHSQAHGPPQRQGAYRPHDPCPRGSPAAWLVTALLQVFEEVIAFLDSCALHGNLPMPAFPPPSGLCNSCFGYAMVF